MRFRKNERGSGTVVLGYNADKMKAFRGLLAILIVLSALSASSRGQSLEDGWLGILPLVSTKKDVEKKLGRPEIDENGYHGFRHDGMFIQVDYAVGPCQADRRGRGSLNVPKDTVRGYLVWFHREFKLSDLKWSKGLYDKQVDPHAWKQVLYVNYKDGISLHVGLWNDTEYVANITFNPSEALRKKFRCPDAAGSTQAGFTATSDNSIEEGWKGIVPCSTVRAVAEEKLGDRQSDAGQTNIYLHEKYRATVFYKQAAKGNPSKDIVQLLIIYPEETIQMRTYKAGRKNFEKEFRRVALDENTTHVVGSAVYSNPKKGLRIEVQRNEDGQEVIGSFWYLSADRSC